MRAPAHLCLRSLASRVLSPPPTPVFARSLGLGLRLACLQTLLDMPSPLPPTPPPRHHLHRLRPIQWASLPRRHCPPQTHALTPGLILLVPYPPLCRLHHHCHLHPSPWLHMLLAHTVVLPQSVPQHTLAVASARDRPPSLPRPHLCLFPPSPPHVSLHDSRPCRACLIVRASACARPQLMPW